MGQRIIMLIGPPCVGKTYFGERIFDNCAERGSCIFIDEKDFQNSQLFFDAVNAAIAAKIKTIIVENYNTTIEQRRIFFNKVINLNKVKVIGIWIESSLPKILNRNQKRSNPIEEDKIKHCFNFKVSPIDTEPFDEMVYVLNDANVAIRTSDPVIKNIVDVLSNL